MDVHFLAVLQRFTRKPVLCGWRVAANSAIRSKISQPRDYCRQNALHEPLVKVCLHLGWCFRISKHKSKTRKCNNRITKHKLKS